MNTLRFSYSNTAFFWVFDAERSLSKYDTSVGRRWNVDPVVKEYKCPYAAFGNSARSVTDWNGDDSIGMNNTTSTIKKGDDYQDSDWPWHKARANSGEVIANKAESNSSELPNALNFIGTFSGGMSISLDNYIQSVIDKSKVILYGAYSEWSSDNTLGISDYFNPYYGKYVDEFYAGRLISYVLAFLQATLEEGRAGNMAIGSEGALAIPALALIGHVDIVATATIANLDNDYCVYINFDKRIKAQRENQDEKQHDSNPRPSSKEKHTARCSGGRYGDNTNANRIIKNLNLVQTQLNMGIIK